MDISGERSAEIDDHPSEKEQSHSDEIFLPHPSGAHTPLSRHRSAPLTSQACKTNDSLGASAGQDHSVHRNGFPDGSPYRFTMLVFQTQKTNKKNIKK